MARMHASSLPHQSRFSAKACSQLLTTLRRYAIFPLVPVLGARWSALAASVPVFTRSRSDIICESIFNNWGVLQTVFSEAPSLVFLQSIDWSACAVKVRETRARAR